MRKFINTIKLPLFCAFMAVLITFTVLLICLSGQPHGDKYNIKQSFLSITSERIFDFDENIVTVYTYKKEELTSTVVYEYKIEEGKLFTREKPEFDFVEMGTINAYELRTKLKNVVLPIELNLTLKCNENIASKNLYTAMIISSAVMVTVCGLLLLFVKKHPKQNSLSEPNFDNEQPISNDTPAQSEPNNE
ncbi:MAG: hypothetical protein J6Q51_04450 [Clostridia bacterium]|nr:hypothetical protein [Clostridia bacterium]